VAATPLLNHRPHNILVPTIIILPKAASRSACRRTPGRFAPQFVLIREIRVKNPSLPSRALRAIFEL
jgi:hypothetical protein